MSVAESLPYRSPVSKLVRFFCGSRDKWKAKCQAAKRENKSLKYRLAVMTENRDRWKAEVRELRQSKPEGTEQAPAKPPKNRAQRPSRRRRSRAAGLGVARTG